MYTQEIMTNFQSIDETEVDAQYSPLNLNTDLSVGEINEMRKNLELNMGFLSANKQRIRHQEYLQLMNFQQFALNVMNNMLNLRMIEKDVTYNKNVRRYSNLDESIEKIDDMCMTNNTSAYYNDKGAICAVDRRTIRNKEGWEKQFDANLINPPCYMLPPTGKFN